MVRLLQFRLLLVPDRDFTITAWCGSFSLKIVYDVFHRVNVDYEKRARKPFVVEPLSIEEKYILSGLYLLEGNEFKPHKKLGCRDVEALTPLTLSVYFFDDDVARKFLEALVKDDTIKEPSADFKVLSVEVEEVKLPPLDYLEFETDVSAKLYVDVRFLSPTAFMFYGDDILYPSPARVLFSSAKVYSDLARIDLRDEVPELLKVLELKWFSARTYWVDIGEGRKVPCFMGKARFVVCGKRDVVKVVNLLKSAEVYGLGISRTLGFGRVKVALSSP